MKFLSITALALAGAVMAGCSGDDDTDADLNTDNVISEPQQPASTDNVVTLTTTVGFSSSSGGGTSAHATTRALTSDGKKTFAIDDQIAVVYTNNSDGTSVATSEALTADDITEGGHSASFTVTLTNPKAGGSVKYIYPAAMAKAEDGSINYDALTTQDGTLSTIASNLDLAVYEGTLTAEAALPTGTCTLANQLAICAFTLKDFGGNNTLTGSITSLTVADGAHTYTVTRSTPAADPIYVAIRPTENANIEYTATTSTETYKKTVSNKTYSSNNIYPLGLKMQKQVNLAQIDAAYIAQNGDILTGTLNVEEYPVQISIAEGATVTLKDVNINGDGDDYEFAGITCLGSATINIEGTNNVKGFNLIYPGIYVPGGSTLTISGTGELTASSGFSELFSVGYGCGIGGGNGLSCGNIEIKSGTVTAAGGYRAAGIGAGNIGSCGYITISGGTVTATGGKNAAGIGAGYSGSCGNITISGGTVEAAGGDRAAGIGAGYSGSCGYITISGGTVEATGGIEAAGIGSGYNDGGTRQCGNITISGGTVMATGGSEAAGIGAGSANGGTSNCGKITISGGTVMATGGNDAAGIGGGFGLMGTSQCTSVTIESTVTKVVATKGQNATDCIGKGSVEDEEDGDISSAGTLKIGGTEINYSTSSFYSAVTDLSLGSFSKTKYEKDTWTYIPPVNTSMDGEFNEVDLN